MLRVSRLQPPSPERTQGWEAAPMQGVVLHPAAPWVGVLWGHRRCCPTFHTRAEEVLPQHCYSTSLNGRRMRTYRRYSPSFPPADSTDVPWLRKSSGQASIYNAQIPFLGIHCTSRVSLKHGQGGYQVVQQLERAEWLCLISYHALDQRL